MLKNCRALIAGWACLCACAGQAAAGNPHFTIDNWDTEKGLPGNSVIAALQTRDGYLWLGTLYGLARFDGIRFVTFNEANTPSLNSSRIVKLFEDSQTNLWIGTDAGGIVVIQQGKVKNVRVGSGTRQGHLASVCEDNAGAVWLYTADGQLCRYYENRGDVWNAGSGFPSRYRALVPEDNLLWVGTDVGLTALGPVPKGVAAGLPVASEAAVSRLDFILAGKKDGVWRLANGRIQKWKGDRLEKGFDWKYPWTNTTPVNAACEDDRGNLVVGTGGEGIFWFDAEGHSVRLTHALSGLAYDTILSLCFDREGDLWVGTDGGGLDRVKRQAFDVVEGTLGATVQSVCGDGSDGLWIGYFGERIDHWHDGMLDHFGREQGLVDLGVKAVLADPDGAVWAGTYLGGLLRLQHGRFLPAPQADRLASDQDISVLFGDTQHRLWAGAQAGLARWDGRQWKMVAVGAESVPVRALAEDAAGGLWVGTQGRGLELLRDGKITAFSKTNGLPSDNVSCIRVDAEGVVWVGTSSGLARYEKGKWISYAGHLGNENVSIGYLLEDEQGTLWLGSNGGLLRARKLDLNNFATGNAKSVPIRSYGRPDGLPTRECSQGSQPAACRTHDGRLWFPTIRGLVSVQPAELRQNTNPPPVLIEGAKIDDQDVLQSTNLLRASPLQLLTVPAGAESIEIRFTSLNLAAPDKGRFRFRMEGHEENWEEWPGTIRSARYSKLPHGHYRFRAIACNEDGVWGDADCSLAVTVLPPFWQTWWFLTLSGLALLATVVGSVHYVSTQKLQRQLAVLRQQEVLEKERARISRDLHDQLGANLTQVALLGELAETDKELPAEVESHARQISLTARETTRALDEIVWTVNPSNDTLEGLINYVCKYAQEYLALAGLKYRLEVPPQLPQVWISPELRHNAFLAAKEAINNIVKHSHATSAWLRLQIHPDQFVLEIEDNGTGLGADAENKGRNGLRNMRKRMEDVGGQFEAGPGAEGGTCVRLSTPLQAHPGPAGGSVLKSTG